MPLCSGCPDTASSWCAGLVSSPRWWGPLPHMPFRVGKVVDSAADYAAMLTDAGCAGDAWETTYVHELIGEHPALGWSTGTALTPVKDVLSEDDWQEFRRELIPILAARYPARDDGRTFFPFRRVFVVARVG